MRIWHQSMGSVQMNNVSDPLKKHAKSVVEEGTEVEIKGLPAKADYVVSLESQKDGSAPESSVTTIDVIGSPYLYNITLRQAIETCRQAEREGYDAFVIGSWTDPFLREMRSAVDIPVVSTVECNLLLGCSMGGLQAHISLNPTMARVVRKRIREYGLEQRVVSVTSLGDIDEWVIRKAWDEPKDLIARFTELAEAAISEGADVIIPSEGIVTEFFFANGVHQIGDAPVFDTFGIAWKYAEYLVNLRRKLNLTVSRKWEYHKASDAQVERVRGALNL